MSEILKLDVLKRNFSGTGNSRLTRKEGKSINLSLHYLEQVILALQNNKANKHGVTHIPYRNSTMTCVLRDSLGGNCRTVFIATVNCEPEYIDETISTCRFAQRCR